MWEDLLIPAFQLRNCGPEFKKRSFNRDAETCVSELAQFPFHFGYINFLTATKRAKVRSNLTDHDHVSAAEKMTRIKDIDFIQEFHIMGDELEFERPFQIESLKVVL